MTTFDSQVRLRQINKPEVSGYVIDVVSQYIKTGNLISIATNTGDLIGVFYPLKENPSDYVTASQLSTYATQAAIDAGDLATLATVAGIYYPSSNPSGFILSSELDSKYLRGNYAANQTDFLLVGSNGSGVIDYKENDHYVLGSPYSVVSFYDFRGASNPFISGFDLYVTKVNGEDFINPSVINKALFSISKEFVQLSTDLQTTGETLAGLISLGGGAQIDTSDLVTLDGTQTITGDKTFIGELNCAANGVGYLSFATGTSPSVTARNFYLKSDGATLFECDRDNLTFSLNDINGNPSLNPFSRKGFDTYGREVINWSAHTLSGGWTADSLNISTGNLSVTHKILGSNWWINESGRFSLGNIGQTALSWDGSNFAVKNSSGSSTFYVTSDGNAYFSSEKIRLNTDGSAYFIGGIQAAKGLAAITSEGKFSGDGSLLTNLNGAGNPQFIVYTTGDQIISGNKTFRGNSNFYDKNGTLRLALTDDGFPNRLTQIRNANGTLVLSADVNEAGVSITNLYDSLGYLRYSAGPTTKIYDGNGILASEDRVFYNTSHFQVASFSSLMLSDGGANPSVDFGNRILSGNWKAQALSISGSPLASQAWVSGAVSGMSAASGAYYPLTGNPSHFITSGQTGAFETLAHANATYVAQISTGNFATTGWTDSNYLLQSKSGDFIDKSSAQIISGAKNFSVQQAFTYVGAPFTVTSTTAVTNLNADLFDGRHGDYYLDLGNFTGSLGGTGNFVTTSQTGVFETSAHASSTYTAKSNTGVFLTTGAADGRYALQANTGVFETSSHASLTYAPSSLTGSFATTGWVDTNYISTLETGGFVDKTSVQTISSVKTFSAQPSFSYTGAPFTVSSVVAVSGLNSDLLDGQHGSYYRDLSVMTGSLAGTGNFVTTGATGSFSNADTLDGHHASEFVFSGNQQSFITGVASGIDSLAVSFPVSFASPPKVQLTVEVSQDILYAVAIKSRTANGFTAIFSDIIQETGVYLHVFATL